MKGKAIIPEPEDDAAEATPRAALEAELLEAGIQPRRCRELAGLLSRGGVLSVEQMRAELRSESIAHDEKSRRLYALRARVAGASGVLAANHSDSQSGDDSLWRCLSGGSLGPSASSDFTDSKPPEWLVLGDEDSFAMRVSEVQGLWRSGRIVMVFLKDRKSTRLAYSETQAAEADIVRASGLLGASRGER